MNVIFITTLSNQFIPGALISINSLIRCCKHRPNITILYWEPITDRNKKLLSQVHPNIEYKSIVANDYPQSEFDVNYREWSYNCHYRYDIFDICADRVIYFDCDIIFNTVMEELIVLDIDIGAVARPRGAVLQIEDREGFSAGLLSIGKNLLCKNIKKKIIDLSIKPAPKDRFNLSRKWVGNEPVLNTFFPSVYQLPEKFNLCTDQVTIECISQPKNLHFIGHKKPWNGQELTNQFDKYIFDKIIDKNGKYYSEIILKKIVKIYEKEKKEVEDIIGQALI